MIAPGRPKRPESDAPQHVVARLVPLDPGLYAFSFAAEPRGGEPVAGLALPAAHVSAAPRQAGALEITDSFGRAGSWLGDRHKVLFVKALTGGSAVLVTGYLAHDPDTLPLDVDIRRVAASGMATLPPVMTLRLGGLAAAEDPQSVGLDVVAHIRNRGDVRFLDTPWVGRLGPGLWIEGFIIVPYGRLAAAAIEYKGLSAGGTETPWIDSGTLCGTRGMGIPLIGFAVRQKAVAGDAPFDCEYTGYFQSGATTGPTRNGAPCRSTIDNDALEGIELRITPRPPRRTGSARA